MKYLASYFCSKNTVGINFEPPAVVKFGYLGKVNEAQLKKNTIGVALYPIATKRIFCSNRLFLVVRYK